MTRSASRPARSATLRALAALAVAAGAALFATTSAEARTPVLQTFPQLPPGPWRVNQPATVSGNVLTLGPYGYVGLFDDSPPNDWIGNADNNLGWSIEARMRLDASVTDDCGSSEPARLWGGDHTTVVTVGFARGQVCLTYPDRVIHPMDTQSAFHTYKLEVRREQVKLSVDGRLVIDHTLTWGGGGTPALMAESLPGTSHWQWLRYDTTPSLRACTIRGTAGGDRLVGGPGADVICGGDGNDELIGGGGDDVLIGGLGADRLAGGRGRDTLVGGEGDDVLDGGTQDDTLYGGGGQDRFPAAAVADGADVVSGGHGTDTADYSARTAPVTVALDREAGDGADGEQDRIGVYRWDWQRAFEQSDVESVIGGAGADFLWGDDRRNALTGGPGVDVLHGGEGEDVLDAVDGAPGDFAEGGNGIDACTVDAGDTLYSCNEPRCYPTSMTMPPPPTTGTPRPVAAARALTTSPPSSSGAPTMPTPPTPPTMSASPSPTCRTSASPTWVATAPPSGAPVRGESGARLLAPASAG